MTAYLISLEAYTGLTLTYWTRGKLYKSGVVNME